MVSDSGPRTVPGGEFLTRVLGGVAGLVTIPLGLVTESGTGQRAVGIANGMFGENAAPRGATLPAAMTIRQDGHQVHPDPGSLAAAFPEASQRIVVFVHGLVETERCWFRSLPLEKSRSRGDFGSRLAVDLPSTPVHVRYNTGRRVRDNGRELAELLTELVGNWPVPVTDLVLIGHSMGGLVARSAVLHAQEQGSAWLSRARRLVCLGTPHTGAQLEKMVVRVGTLLDRFAVTAPLSRILALRSDGIKDLARGHVHPARRDDRSDGPGPAFPAGVRQCFVAATLARSESSIWSRLVGDLLVMPSSAGDPGQDADLRWVGGLTHFDLVRHDAVYDIVLDWLAATRASVTSGFAGGRG